MEPEEIDKLFKNRLGNLPVPPSSDAWLRLQAKMEPPQKERSLWIYYAAASVVILLVAGLLVLRHYNPEVPATIARTEENKPAEKIIKNLPATQATAEKPLASTEETIASTETEAEKIKEITQPVIEKKAIILAESKTAKTKEHKKAVKDRPVIKTTVPVETATENKEISIAQNKDTRPAKDNKVMTANTPAAPAVVQVLVKMDDTAEQVAVNSEEMSLRENISRKGILLKNIYKQARNLKNGEPVELATLGLNTDKINAEKENIKQKINKVISL